MTEDSKDKNQLTRADSSTSELMRSDEMYHRGLKIVQSEKPKTRKLTFPKQSGAVLVNDLSHYHSFDIDPSAAVTFPIGQEAVGELEIPERRDCVLWLDPGVTVYDVSCIKGLRVGDVLCLSFADDAKINLSDDMIKALNGLGCSFALVAPKDVSQDLLLRFGKMSTIARLSFSNRLIWIQNNFCLPATEWNVATREDWLYEAFHEGEAPQNICDLDLNFTHDGELLSQLLGLKGLRIGIQEVSESTCVNLGKLTNLQDLKLNTTDKGYDILTSSLSQLSWLEVGGRRLTDAGLHFLTRLAPTLQRLKITNCKLAGPGLSNLSACPALTDLRFDLTVPPDETLGYLGELPRLRKLSLTSSNELNGIGLQHLWKVPNLRELNLLCPLNASASDHLPVMDHLEKIWLGRGADPMPLYRFPSLNQVSFSEPSEHDRFDHELFNRRRRELGFTELSLEHDDEKCRLYLNPHGKDVEVIYRVRSDED